MQPTSSRSIYWFCAVFTSAVLSLSAQVIIQPNGPAVQLQGQQPKPAGEESDASGVIVITDRKTQGDLERAAKFISEERYDDAVNLLSGILMNSNDSLYKPNFEKKYYRSIRSEARRLLSEMPAEGQEAFQLNFGAQADRALKDALADSNYDLLNEVIRAYFHTTAGYEATWIFGRLNLDHGHPLTAATSLQRLYDVPRARADYEPALSTTLAWAWWRAGVPERAIAVLTELRKSSPSGFNWKQQSIPWFQEPAAGPAWMTKVFGPANSSVESNALDWGVYRGNPARNAQTQSGSPLLNPRWEVTLQDTASASKSTAQTTAEKQLSQTNRVNLPLYHPLAVGSTVLVQRAQQLQGIDFRTGKLKWLYPPVIGSAPTPIDPSKIMIPTMTGTIPASSLMTSARLSVSCDATQAYYVEESNAPINMRPTNIGFARTNQQNTQPVSNVLSALNLEREGYLRWQVGGPSGESESKLAGAFFYGAPLPIHGQLYILGEIGSELNLFCLSPASGQLIWAQPLIRFEVALTSDPLRRMSSMVPSYSDGVMICPTNSSTVVAVDIFNRGLLWLQSYQQVISPAATGLAARRMMMMNGGVLPETNTERWADGVASISQGKVIIGPADSEELYCLDLMTGQEYWKMRRNEFPDRSPQYIAQIDNDLLLVVGKQQVYGLSLLNKSLLYSISLDGATPNGRGYQSGVFYYLPLQSGVVLKIDTKAAKIVAQSKSRQSVIPGNLIVHQGQILSINHDRVQCFYSLDTRQEWVNEKLRENPNDPAAILAQGEILLNSGDISGAAKKLEQVWLKQHDDYSRTLLAEALLQLLKTDYQSSVSYIPRLKEVVNTDSQREELSRLLVEQYLLGREFEKAIDEVVVLCSLPGVDELETSEPGKRSLRRDRWVLEKLQLASQQVEPQEWKKLSQILQQRIEVQLNQSQHRATQKMLASLGQLYSTDQARLDLARTQIKDKLYLEAELELLSLQAKPDQGAAWGEHIKLLQTMQRESELLGLISELKRQSPELELAPGQNVQQRVTELLASAALREQTAANQPWPLVTPQKTITNRVMNVYRFPLEIHNDRGPFYRDSRIDYENNSQELVGFDNQGQEFFRLPLSEIHRVNVMGFNPNMSQARFIGHLLLVNAGYSVAGYDLLTIKDKRPKLLWKFDVLSTMNDVRQNHQYRSVRQVNGRQRLIPIDSNGRTVCNISLVSRDLVCVARQGKLFALDARTGEILWLRHDARGSGEICGDTQTISTFVEQSSEVVSYDAQNGKELGTFKVAPENQRISYQEGKLFSSETLDAKQVIKLTDLRTGKTNWSNNYAVNARAVIVDQEYLAVLEQRGLVSIIKQQTGELVFSSNINPEANVQEYQVLRDDDRLIVIVGRSFGNKPNSNVNGISNGNYQSIPFTGHLYGINIKNGKLLWERKVEELSYINSQPTGTPALILGSQVNTSENNGNTYRQFTRVAIVDKRTGEIVCDEQSQNGNGMLQINQDRNSKKVTVQTQAQLLTLQWNAEEKK